MSTNMTNFRKEYQYDHLSEENAGADPFALFERWLQLAGESAIHEPNAMALATATPNGRPSIRLSLIHISEPTRPY